MSDFHTPLVQARQGAEALDSARAAIARLISTLEAGAQHTVQAPLNAPSIAVQHRAEHRMGVPSRIESDPELREFALERITQMTYKQVVAEVAAHFPPDRRTNVSSLQRWWRKQHPA